jgi:ferredoxin-type protein NapH
MGSLLRRHLDSLRLVVLGLVFAWLVFLPLASRYGNVEAAHAYEHLEGLERLAHHAVALIVRPFITEAGQLDAVKGSTWAATLFGVRLTDPLAVLGQSAARLRIHWAFAATALVPLVVTLLFGRVFCGWICPAGFIYELVDRLRSLLHRLGMPPGDMRLDKRLRFGVLAAGLAASALGGGLAVSALYPPAVVGRELNYAILGGGVGTGALFLLATLLFDLLVARRGFCRYLCPGGALYSALGRHRLLRVQRQASRCVDCARCSQRCMFALDPMRDRFGQDCSNCGACMAVCPTGALSFGLHRRDREGPLL